MDRRSLPLTEPVLLAFGRNSSILPGREWLDTFCSQISSVFRHPDKGDIFIALADRWLPELSEEIFARLNAGERAEDLLDMSTLACEPNTSVADYVWLPLRFDGDMPIIEWYDEWRVEDFE